MPRAAVPELELADDPLGSYPQLQPLPGLSHPSRASAVLRWCRPARLEPLVPPLVIVISNSGDPRYLPLLERSFPTPSDHP